MHKVAKASEKEGTRNIKGRIAREAASRAVGVSGVCKHGECAGSDGGEVETSGDTIEGRLNFRGR